MNAFERWWHNEGSGITPRPGEDMEQHARRVAEIAWSNGAFKADELMVAGKLASDALMRSSPCKEMDRANHDAAEQALFVAIANAEQEGRA